MSPNSGVKCWQRDSSQTPGLIRWVCKNTRRPTVHKQQDVLMEKLVSAPQQENLCVSKLSHAFGLPVSSWRVRWGRTGRESLSVSKR